MKITKKIIALVLSLLMLVSGFAVSSSALDNNNFGVPVFKATVISETSQTVVIQLSLTSGNFDAVDFTFVPQNNLSSVLLFTKANDLKALQLDDNNTILVSSNASTGKMSMAASPSIEGNVSLYNITFSKKQDVAVSTSDLKIEITNCECHTDANTSVNVTSQAKATFSLIDIEFDVTDISLNYRQTQQINVTTDYDTSKLVWSTSNSKVAEVEDGLVKTVGTGTAVIRAETEDGQSFAECTVTSSYSTFQWIIVILFFGWIWY